MPRTISLRLDEETERQLEEILEIIQDSIKTKKIRLSQSEMIRILIEEKWYDLKSNKSDSS